MSFLSDLIFGIREIRNGAGVAAPLRRALKIIGADVTDDPATGETVITITGDGAVPLIRQIIAGPGLLGGGSLDADRTLTIRLRSDAGSGLALFGTGLGARTARSSGSIVDGAGNIAPAVASEGGLIIGSGFGSDTTPENNGVGLLRWGGNESGIETGPNGARVRIASTLQRDVNGIGVNPANVAVLSAGKITAGNSRGMTLVTPVTRDTADANIAISGVLNTSGPVFNGTARDTGGTRVLTGSIAVQIGDVLDFHAFINSAAAANNFDVYIRLSSGASMASPGTIYAEQHVSGTAAGGAVALFECWTATVNATITWSVVVAKYGAIANFNVAQRNAVIKRFQT